MARDEADREDLLGEARALVERIELRLPQDPEPIVAGFRSNGALSLYFGGQPVYQFNAAGELRRAFLGGSMFKAQSGELWQIDRVRTVNNVELRTQALGTRGQQAFLNELDERLANLLAALDAGRARVVGVVPAERDVGERLRAWLKALGRPIAIASRPGVGG